MTGSTAISACTTDWIEARVAPLRQRLTEHPLYASIGSLAELRTFMESHVFAVWDFMSLLKALQQRLTCVSVPWVPLPWPESRRFVNEIVLGEESDAYEGRAISHFELYLEAMEACNANTSPIHSLVDRATAEPGNLHLNLGGMPAAAEAFVQATFAVIRTGSLPALAAAFTFGREDVIPDMFREMVRDLNQQRDGQISKFAWYLQRHIEVDGDDHGPLSLRMIADICGQNEAYWEEAASAAETALKARLALWDGILASTKSEGNQKAEH